MSEIVSQVEENVKCACGETVFRDGLCLVHFAEAETQIWDDWDAERQGALEAVGYVFGDSVEVPA